jgi:hypothetical protein
VKKVLYNRFDCDIIDLTTAKRNYIMTNFESRVLATVKTVTDIRAYFFNGTMFLETEDSAVATNVFFELCDRITPAISFGKCGQSETSYDFLAA